MTRTYFNRQMSGLKGPALILVFLVVQLAVLLLSAFSPVRMAQAAANNADLPYLRVWERTDYPVALGLAQRSWYWGPAPFAADNEPYKQSSGGARNVQYWDKSRMEITNPATDQNSKWYVTNGLLARELVTGKIQVGDNEYQNSTPANVPVSGDNADINPDAPTYASFKDVVSLALDKRAPRTNSAITTTIDKAGNISSNATLASRYPETAIAYYEDKLGHNIPTPFWRFMNAAGSVIVNQRPVNQVIEDWTFAMGLPISEAYWTRSRVGGQEKDVLVQLFERRVLTYTPSNNEAYRVEMGNVGRHYYNWRYASGAKPAPIASYAEPITRISIPAIKVDGAIEYVGQTPAGAMDVPYKPADVAWYKQGTRVGEKGNAVITGHYDYVNYGKAVFWDLDKLKPGDIITVTTTSGTKFNFKVIGSEKYNYLQVPLTRLFGDSTTANLNLVTCNGAFDKGSANYDERLVVYTTLV